MAIFADRVEAGRELAFALSDFVGSDAVVLAIPRGGVVVGYEIACKLGTQLDIIIPRKLGAPHNPELAIGAVTEDGTVMLDRNLIKHLEVTEVYIESEVAKQRTEIEHRLRLYRGATPYPELENQIVIIVDDGIATGSTITAAVMSVRKRKAKTITVVVPVGPPSTVGDLKNVADRVICLFTPEPFLAIGQFYKDFGQTTDDKVIRLLRSAKRIPGKHLRAQ